MKRILVCSPPLTAIGGIAKHTALLNDHLGGVEIFNQWWPLPERGTSALVRVLVHGVALGRFLARLVARRPDYVHLQVSHPGLRRDVLYARLAKAAGITVVSHLHSEFLPHQLPALVPLMRLSWRVIALSHDTRERIVSFWPSAAGKVRVIPNPISPTYLTSPVNERGRSGTFDVVMVGVISPLKNQVAVARVIEGLRTEGVDIKLTLVGPAAPEATSHDLDLLAESVGVTMLGRLDEGEVIAALDRASVLVLFSMSEGEPLVILEAMARALPVIASDVGSVRSVLPAALYNVIVPTGDDRALRAALLELVDLQQDLGETGRINRSWVERERSLELHLARLRMLYGAEG